MRVVVVGAGLAGLTAAREIAAAGHEVVVLDKGRGVGGRLATRRIGDARFDHGAQFFTVRSAEFAALVDAWAAAGVVRTWCHGFGEADGHPRWVGATGMTDIAKHLARDLDVRCEHLVFSLHDDGGPLRVVTDDGRDHPADAVVVTTPVPQAWSFLVGIEAEPPEVFRGGDYERTLALLAVLDSDAHGVPAPGGVQNPSPEIQFVADNKAKGISPVPALTVHFSPAFSLDHWDDEPESLHRLLIDTASPWVGAARIVDSQVKKWRLATPGIVHPDSWWRAGDHRVFLAGDAFAGPRVEGAVLSGLAVARAVCAS